MLKNQFWPIFGTHDRLSVLKMLYRVPRPRNLLFTYPAFICDINIRFLWNFGRFAKFPTVIKVPKWAWFHRVMPGDFFVPLENQSRIPIGSHRKL